jgi:peptidyl-tRNA hydrolase
MEQRTPDEHDVPWAMQLAVRVEKGTEKSTEKTAPPSHSAVCEAAAMAVVRLLTDPNPEWQQAVHRWESGRIRKVTRRARGVRWEAVQRLPGVTVEHAGAQVRSFVPGPVTEVPPELAKLQVAGLDLEEHSDDDSDDDSHEREAIEPPEHPYAALALNPDVRMSTGKAAAQCGHAAHLLLRQAAEPGLSAWIVSGLRVHLVRGETWRRCVDRATVAVRDAGFTEVPPGTMTAIAWLVLS